MKRFFIKVDSTTKKNGKEIGEFIANILLSGTCGPVPTKNMWKPGSAAIRELENAGIFERRKGKLYLIDSKLWRHGQTVEIRKPLKLNDAAGKLSGGVLQHFFLVNEDTDYGRGDTK